MILLLFATMAACGPTSMTEDGGSDAGAENPCPEGFHTVFGCVATDGGRACRCYPNVDAGPGMQPDKVEVAE
jgi:hypothetical protein